MTKVKRSKVKRSKVKRSKVKRVKRVKRTMRRSLKRRSFKKNKKRTKKTRTKKTKTMRRLRGGMVQQHPIVLKQPHGFCYKKGNYVWTKVYYAIHDKTLNFYTIVKRDSGDGLYGEGKRGSSISDLTGTQLEVSDSPETIGMNFLDKNLYTLLTVCGPDGSPICVELAFPEIAEYGQGDPEILKGAIENISAGRDWDISEEEQTERERVETERVEAEKIERERVETERVGVEEIARAAAQTEENTNEELRARAKYDIFGLIQKNGITDPLEKFKYTMKEFRNFLSELLSVNIKSIEGFTLGSFGLIVIVIVDDLRKVLKITLEYPRETSPCNNEKIEFDIQSKVTEIQEDITIGVDSFTCVTGITPIVGMRQLIMAISGQSADIENHKIADLGEKRLRIPGEWEWKEEWWLTPVENICFSIIIMDYLEGINLSTFLKSSTDKKLKEVLEDFRKKINLLHKNGIYHCDLHYGNVMVRNSDNTIRIIDFGQSTLVESSDNPEWDETKNCGARHIVQEDSERMAQVLVQGNCPGPWGQETTTCLD